MKKKLLSLVLALTLLIGVIPMSALADESDEATPTDLKPLYTLTVNYHVPEGYEQPEAYTRSGMKQGESYSVTSPEVAGLIPDQAVVSGTIDSADVTATVTYAAHVLRSMRKFSISRGVAPASVLTESTAEHIHEYTADWKYFKKPADAEGYAGVSWNPTVSHGKAGVCACGENDTESNVQIEAHTFDETNTCTKCGYQQVYTVIVQYTVPAGYTAPQQVSKTGIPGTEYSFTSPAIEGLMPDQPLVAGVIGSMYETYTVNYTADTHTVTVSYTVPEGYEAPAPQSVTNEPGTEYRIESPAIADLKAEQDVVAGTIGSADEAYTVAYNEIRYVITVRYEVPAGYQAPGRKIETGKAGTKYNIKSPEVAGLVPDKDEVKGTIGGADETFTVTYYPSTYTVKVNYTVPEGYAAPSSVSKSGTVGTEYSFDTPAIEGLVPDKTNVSGKIGSADETFTVAYSEGPHTVTVKYTVPDGYEAQKPEDQNIRDAAGTAFSFDSPVIDGLTPDQDKVAGTIGHVDETYTVTYTGGTHTVLVQYAVPDGYVPPKQQSKTGKPGVTYSFTSPVIDGLKPDQMKVEGTIGEADEAFAVTYTEKAYKLTVTYQVPEGYTAPDPYTQEGLKTNETYSVRSPSVAGLQPDKDFVSGTIAQADVAVTVTYTETDHVVTVSYTVPEGYTAPDPQGKTGPRGTAYSFTSPAISGLTPDQTVVSGEIGGKDQTITVTYTENSVGGTCTNGGHHRYVTTSAPGDDQSHHLDLGNGESVVYYNNVIQCMDCDEIVLTYRHVGGTYYHESHSEPDHFTDYGTCHASDPCPLCGARYVGDHSLDSVIATSSGTAYDGKTYSAGDTIRACVSNGCGHVETVASKAPAYSVTVSYVVPDGYTAPAPVTRSDPQGTEYYIESPEIKGLKPDRNYVAGEIGTADQAFTVTYSLHETFTVTVNYVDAANTGTVLYTKTQTVEKGSGYLICSPSLIGGRRKPRNEYVYGTDVTADLTREVLCDEAYKLIIHYTFPEGYPHAKDYITTLIYKTGEDYNVESPAYKSVDPTVPAVTGTMGSQPVEVTVEYLYNTFTTASYWLTIDYKVPEGFTAPSQVHMKVESGQRYSVDSPYIEKLAPSWETVSGTIRGADVHRTVVYYEKATSRLTINYTVPAASAARQPDSYVAELQKGESYQVRSPKLAGLFTDTMMVEGTIGEQDVTVEVVYYEILAVEPQEHELTINYIAAEGGIGHMEHYRVKAGAMYYYPTPAVDHAKPDREYVSGAMPDSDHFETVTYTKAWLLTINYIYPEDYTGPKSPTYSKLYTQGEKYRVQSPLVNGMYCRDDKWKVEGTMGTKDVTVDVTLAWFTPRLKIEYTFPQNYPGDPPATYTKNLRYGERYEVPTPQFEHLKPSSDVIQGVMSVADINRTVAYEWITHKLTVNFTFPENYTGPRPETHTEQVRETGNWRFLPPVLQEIKPKTLMVQGTMGTEDQEVTIEYGIAHKLTVLYRFGQLYTGDMPKTFSYVYLPGEEYSVPSPQIEGWKPDTATVAGTMGEEDVTVTVEYWPLHTLTINFVYPEDYTGEKHEPVVLEGYAERDHYSYTAPEIARLHADPVEGTIWTDTIDTVYYGWKYHTLRVYYVVPEEYVHLLPADNQFHTEQVIEGDPYSFTPPTIPGLPHTPEVVEGVMGQEDVEVSVVYGNSQVLTVNYVFPEDYIGTRPETHTEAVERGGTYSFTPPELEGLIAEPTVVSGTMGEEDITETVSYRWKMYTLTVDYKMPDNFTGQKPDAHTEQHHMGEAYSYNLPNIPGALLPVPNAVTGVMPGEDVTVTVEYRECDHHRVGHKEIDDKQHEVICILCEGVIRRDYHDRRDSDYDDAEHWLACSHCGYEYPHEGHSMVWTYTEGLGHIRHCSGCRYIEDLIEEHQMVERVINGQRKLVCTMCGLTQTPYEVIEGNDQTVYSRNGSQTEDGAGDTATFRIRGDSKNFTGQVEGDGKPLTRGKDFTDWDGSLYVQLTEEYLSTLAAGKHTLTVHFTDGIATADFYILGQNEIPALVRNENGEPVDYTLEFTEEADHLVLSVTAGAEAAARAVRLGLYLSPETVSEWLQANITKVWFRSRSNTLEIDLTKISENWFPAGTNIDFYVFSIVPEAEGVQMTVEALSGTERIPADQYEGITLMTE